MSTATDMTLLELLAKRVDEHEYGVSKLAQECGDKPLFASFAKFLGRTPMVSDLNRDAINGFTDWLKSPAAGLANATQVQRRKRLNTYVKFAVEESLIEQPKKLRKIKAIPKNSDAWSPEEISQLIGVAITEEIGKRRLPLIGIQAGLFLGSIISAGYDSVLRLGDLLDLKKSDLRRLGPGEGATILLTMNKTKHLIQCSITAETLGLIDRVIAQGDPNRELVWPMWGKQHRTSFYKRIRELVKRSGISKGTFRYIRRGAVTDAENSQAGLGTLLAGHRSNYTTKTHYVDHSKLNAPSVNRPSLVPKPSQKPEA